MHTIHHGDCLDVLRSMPDNSVHAIVTDPPYGLSNTTPDQVAETIVKWVSGDREYLPTGKGFMGRAWDAFVPPVAVWDEAMRVLKPGGHVLAFAGTRTMDLMTLGLRLSGFDIRDSVAWLYGSGFPKSMDISKAIDKAAGAEREVIGPARHRLIGGKGGVSTNHGRGGVSYGLDAPSAPATPAAREWEGWGTALKPATEPIVMARKPFNGTVAANVLEHGTGGLNIDGTRIGTDENLLRKATAGGSFRFHGFSTVEELRQAAETGGRCPDGRDAAETYRRYLETREEVYGSTSGRWPANVILDEHMAGVLDQQSGWQKDGTAVNRNKNPDAVKPADIYGTYKNGSLPDQTYGSGGGASRFFYVAKASKRERPDVDGIKHPTVKPLALMRWLVRLVTPPDGIVLDPFAGSGATIEAAMLEGFQVIGIEREAEYLPLIQHRIHRAQTAQTEAPEQGAFAFKEAR